MCMAPKRKEQEELIKRKNKEMLKERWSSEWSHALGPLTTQFVAFPVWHIPSNISVSHPSPSLIRHTLFFWLWCLYTYMFIFFIVYVFLHAHTFYVYGGVYSLLFLCGFPSILKCDRFIKKNEKSKLYPQYFHLLTCT